jgi:5-hydroxyisourate hydrolase-like protein (transthyretin family)
MIAQIIAPIVNNEAMATGASALQFLVNNFFNEPNIRTFSKIFMKEIIAKTIDIVSVCEIVN